MFDGRSSPNTECTAVVVENFGTGDLLFHETDNNNVPIADAILLEPGDSVTRAFDADGNVF